MAIKIHKSGLENAMRLINAGEVETFDADWNEEKPTLEELVYFINHHDMSEYGRWFLGIDDKFPVDTKEHYVFPYGDLKTVQKCALVNTLNEAQKSNHQEIAHTANQLIQMIDKKK
ncbi:MAG: hypothetical protein BWY54_00303 [Candidatus Dependentiae bacterium ADurb.Bin331]|nr:MAG: hypothetical protein BWY54_00303 [Candidatus Dependentiae bacterium ADurb.Bin331]